MIDKSNRIRYGTGIEGTEQILCKLIRRGKQKGRVSVQEEESVSDNMSFI